MRLILSVSIAAALVITEPSLAQQPVFEGPVPRATCGPGSQPEPANALQGEVPVADRENGRSLKPYTCNLELTGRAPSQGAGWQTTWHDHCAYYATNAGSDLGTQVVDVSDPAKPKITTALTTAAMLGPWESLSTAGDRGIIGAVDQATGAAFFDLYDVKGDCANPKLLYSGAMSGLNHEGNFSMDGRTYYASGIAPNQITAIDVDDPTNPSIITSWVPHATGHGLATNPEGTRLYATELITTSVGSALTIWDTSAIQARMPGAQPREIGKVGWTDGTAAQHTLWTSYQGKPFVVFVDEGGYGATRIIDISDETRPAVVAKLKLEVQMPDNADRRAESEGMSGSFGYNTHYCGIDRQVDPTALACSNFASGIRVFDIRDPYNPREIAYFNPGGTGEASPPGSQEGVEKSTSGYPSARVRFVKERGEIWFTDQNKGFHVARFTNGVWPFDTPALGPHPVVNAKPCRRAGSVRVRIKRAVRRQLRTADVFIDGKRVKRIRNRALRRPVTVRLPRGKSVVRIVARSRSGKRYTQTHRYARCA